MGIEITLLCGCVRAAGCIAPEVTAAIRGVLAVLVLAELTLLLGYIGAANDIAWEVTTAILGVLGALMQVEVPLHRCTI